MSTTGRLLRWIAAGLLCCSGCAAPLWPGWTGRHREQVESADADTSAAGPSTGSVQGEAIAAASAQETARELGLPEPEAARLAEIFLGAYAEIYRQATQTAQAEQRSRSEWDATGQSVGPAASRGSDARAEPAPRERGRPAALTPADVAAPSDSGNRVRGPSGFDAASPARSRDLDSPPAPQVAARADPAGHEASTAQLARHDQTLAPSGAGGRSDVPIGDATPADAPQGPWTRHVRLAIQRLQDELAHGDLNDQQRAHGQVCLSLLSLAAEDPAQALEGLRDLDDQQLEFWRQTVMGMGVLLDPEDLPKLRHRVALATRHLQDGLAALATLGPLQLRNVTLCTKVDGFGDFVECSSYGLEPGKPVILYVEVENFTSDLVPAPSTDDTWARSAARRDGRGAAEAPRYATELHARYDILDATQRTIVSRALPVGSDVCRNRRRDYYISYVLYLPEQIAPGAYTLELTVEDKKGGKFGSAVVGFQIPPR